MNLSEAIKRYRAQFGYDPLIWGMRAEQAVMAIEHSLRTGIEILCPPPDNLFQPRY